MPTKPQPPIKRRVQPAPSRDDTYEASKSYIRSVASETKPYLKFAFANPFIKG